MIDISGKNYKNLIKVHSAALIFFTICFIVMIYFKGIYLAILFALAIIVFIVTIIFYVFKLISYKKNNQLYNGYIEDIKVFRGYHIQVKGENNECYKQTLVLVSSKIKDLTGKNCSYILDNKNRIFIKNIF